jgi:hypothetical protein
MGFARIFRIFYSTFYVLLVIVLCGLILITPADTITQARGNNQIYNSYIIAGGYATVVVIGIFLYGLRLYTNRAVLAAIPKTWIPVEKGDVSKKVRKMVEESLKRSAMIAWDARPRASPHMQATVTPLRLENTHDEAGESKEKEREKSKLYQRMLRRTRTKTEKDEDPLSIPPHPPVWGEIAHDGWSSPMSADLSNLQYVSVIQELPHLVEAKAVSLSPPDPNSSPTTSPAPPDLRAVELLQRTVAMGLRDYMSHLTSLGVLSPTAPVATFLTTYENARFSSKPLSESSFRELMRLFAEILRDMTPLNPTIMQSIEADDESDIDGDQSSTTTAESHDSQSIASAHSPLSRRGSEGTVRTVPSRRARLSGYNSVSATPSKKPERHVERSPSIQSFAQTRRPYPISQASSSSLRSQSSVIRLSHSQSGADLPYTLNVPSGPV